MSDNVQTEATEEADQVDEQGGAPAGDAPATDEPATDEPATDEDAEHGEELEAQPPFEAAEGEAPAALEAGPPAVDPVRDRLLLPILLPLLSMVAVFVYVVNVSRVFLASGNETSVLVGTIITVGILAGGAAISASPRLRSSTLVMGLSGFMVLVLSAGLLSLGPSEEEEDGGGGFQEPSGPAVATLEVDALPSLTFQATEFSTPAGINQINYNDLGGTHTLLFTDPKFSGFQLAVPQGPKSGKVNLTPGTYTIYCNIPGHRAAGMQATLNVGPAAGPPPEGAPPEGAPPGS
jgi:plastocyanin